MRAGSAGWIGAEVDLVEIRGSTAYLVCDLDGRELTVLKQGDGVAAGDRVALSFDFDAVNFFDEADEPCEEPDRRLFSNQLEVRNGGADSLFAISPSIFPPPTRFFRDLTEDNVLGEASVEVPLGPAFVKAGGRYKTKTREFRETRFEVRADEARFRGNFNAFAMEKAGLIGKDDRGTNQFGTFIQEVVEPSNNYDGDQDVGAGFLADSAYWETALETFEAVDAPHDALETLERLFESASERGDDRQADLWVDDRRIEREAE